MKKLIFSLVIPLLLAAGVHAQTLAPIKHTNDDHILTNKNEWALTYFNIPRGPVPGFPSTIRDVDKCGALFNKTTTGQPDTLKQYDCSTNAWVNVSHGGGSGGGSWGLIIGTLSDQTDLQAALNAKQGTLTFDATPTSASNNPVKSGGVFTALAGKQASLSFDSTPTSSSTNPVTSGGVFTALAGKQASLGFTAENSANKATVFTTLNNTLYPTTQAVATYVAAQIAGGGTSYTGSNGVNLTGTDFSSDTTFNRTVSNSFTKAQVQTLLAAKQAILTFDSSPTSSSTHPVTSGGVFTALAAKQAALTFDSTPTSSSTNPVTSGGVFTALAGKQASLSFDSTPTSSSTNPVTSAGVFTALAGKQASITLTTTGTSGASTFIGNTLNIPNYANTTYTANNGLTLSGTNFTLGGTLSTNESILLGGNILSIHNVSSSITSDASFGASFGHLQLTDAANNTAIVAVGLDVGSHALAKLGIDVASNTTSLTKTAGTAGFVITDTQDLKGISYAADYSANYTARSLIDKGYADSHYAATGGGGGTYTGSNGVSLVGSDFRSDTTFNRTVSNSFTKAQVQTLLAAKQASLTFDSTPTSSSTNPVTSGGVFTALAGKQASLSGTGYVKFSGTTPSYVASIGNADLANSAMTLNGTSTSLGGTFTVTKTNTDTTSTGFATRLLINNYATKNSPTFTGTVGLAGDILPNATNTYSIGGSANYLLKIWTNQAQITNLTASNATFGTPGGSMIFINGTTSGQIQLTPQPTIAGGASYSWDWPVTHGTAGQVLTSDGGVGIGGGMTWTTLTNYAFTSPTATTQSALDNSTKIATTAFADAAVAATAIYFASGSFTGTGTALDPYTIVGGGGGVTTVGTFSGTSKTNGASIASSTITFGPADATNPGMMTTGAQTFGTGTKTFGGTVISPVFQGAASSFDIVLKDGSGNNAFRSTSASGWSDAATAQFFQVGASTSKAFFTAASGTIFNRLGFSAGITQFTTGSYTSTPVPTGVFDINDGTNSLWNLTSGGATSQRGSLTLSQAGSKINITEGTNGSTGQTTLVAGTKAITISGLSTSSRAFVTLVSAAGSSSTVNYQGVCTANTLTLRANVGAGTINTSDTSVLNYIVIN